MKKFACLILVLVILFSAYELHTIASTDHHNAYCSQVSNAANDYMSNPNLSRGEFSTAHKSLTGVLNEGNKYPVVPEVSTMLALKKAVSERSQTSDIGVIGYENLVKQITASYLVANNC